MMGRYVASELIPPLLVQFLTVSGPGPKNTMPAKWQLSSTRLAPVTLM